MVLVASCIEVIVHWSSANVVIKKFAMKIGIIMALEESP